MVSEVESSAARSMPRLRAPHGSPSGDTTGVDDPDIRLSLSSAALRSAEVECSGEFDRSPAQAPAPTPEREASESTPRRHPIDAYRETSNAHRGERLRIVV